MDMRPPAGDRRSVMIESGARDMSDAGLVRARNIAGGDMDVEGGIIKKSEAAATG